MPPTPAPPVDDAFVAADPRDQRNVLIAMCTALIAVVASVSGLNVAQQELAIDFGASQSAVLWIINAYTIALAALLLPVGAIGDRWGRKPVLLAGLGLFGVASVIGAFASSAAVMIAARVLAGVAAAMIMPVTLSVITSSFPAEDRSRAIGIWAGFAGTGGILGLFFAAFTVDVIGWRYLFALPIVLAAVSFAATQAFIPNSREHDSGRFDVVGSVLSALAIGGIVLGIHEGPERGWSDSITIAGLVVGLVALAAFVLWELRQEHPLLDMSVFTDRNLTSGSSTLLIVFGVQFGIFLVIFPYLQVIVGWSALRSAASLLPMALVMMPTSTVAPRIASRIGARITMLTGVGILGLGLATLALFVSVEGGYMSIFPGLMLMGLGLGLSMTPSTEAITSTLPAEKQGVASALNDTTREIGGAVGVALLGSILSAGYRDAVAPSVTDAPPEVAEAVKEGIGGAMAVAAEAGEAGPAIVDAAQHAFVDGWVSSMWVGVAMAGVAFLILLVRGPRPAANTTATDAAATDAEASDAISADGHSPSPADVDVMPVSDDLAPAAT